MTIDGALLASFRFSFIFSDLPLLSSTTIESRKFRIPSDLRRQPGYRPVSSKVGDHLRILLGVVVHSFLGVFSPMMPVVMFRREFQQFDLSLISGAFRRERLDTLDRYHPYLAFTAGLWAVNRNAKTAGDGDWRRGLETRKNS